MEAPSKKPGKIMLYLAWICGLLLLVQFFARHQSHQINPNQTPTTVNYGQSLELVLESNRKGHYLVNGEINDVPVTFMLDTGATDVVVPYDLATRLGLNSEGSGIAITANGTVRLEKTTINNLSISDINLYNVRASLNPGMEAAQPILLGMSALRHLELNHANGYLTIKQQR